MLFYIRVILGSVRTDAPRSAFEGLPSVRFVAPTAPSKPSVFGRGPAWFDTVKPPQEGPDWGVLGRMGRAVCVGAGVGQKTVDSQGSGREGREGEEQDEASGFGFGDEHFFHGVCMWEGGILKRCYW